MYSKLFLVSSYPSTCSISWIVDIDLFEGSDRQNIFTLSWNSEEATRLLNIDINCFLVLKSTSHTCHDLFQIIESLLKRLQLLLQWLELSLESDMILRLHLRNLFLQHIELLTKPIDVFLLLQDTGILFVNDFHHHVLELIKNALQFVTLFIFIVFILVCQHNYDIQILAAEETSFKNGQCFVHIALVLEKELILAGHYPLVARTDNSNHKVEHDDHVEDSLNEPNRPNDSHHPDKWLTLCFCVSMHVTELVIFSPLVVPESVVWRSNIAE